MNVKHFPIDQNSTYHFFESSDCNLVNPVIYIGNTMEGLNYQLDLTRIQADPLYRTLSSRSRIELTSRIKTINKQKWKDEYENILQSPLPEELLKLLQEKKKKPQQKLIKELVFESSLFLAIPIHAWHLYKMPFTRVTANYRPKEFDRKLYPSMLYKKSDGEFDYLGPTNLSKAEMSVAVDKNRHVVADFIGDEINWHCFFRTMAGIKGNEIPHVGSPHLHYISSAWGIKRQAVIYNLSSYRYSLQAETIPFKPKEYLEEETSSPQS